MYAADDEAYRAYGATFVGWGGAHTAAQVKRHHALGVRCTGHMWCLTAGAKLLHEDAKLRAAVAVDIQGKPVAIIPEIGAALVRRTWVEDIRTWSAPAPKDDGISLLAAVLCATLRPNAHLLIIGSRGR